ncbi:MAG: hypothetical protein R2697_14345 [Ilumatobacteraceae bacterium]
MLRRRRPRQYRVTPIGISTDGQWAIATEAADALAAGPAALPSRLDPRRHPVADHDAGRSADQPERTSCCPAPRPDG